MCHCVVMGENWGLSAKELYQQTTIHLPQALPLLILKLAIIDDCSFIFITYLTKPLIDGLE